MTTAQQRQRKAINALAEDMRDDVRKLDDDRNYVDWLSYEELTKRRNQSLEARGDYGDFAWFLSSLDAGSFQTAIENTAIGSGKSVEFVRQRFESSIVGYGFTVPQPESTKPTKPIEEQLDAEVQLLCGDLIAKIDHDAIRGVTVAQTVLRIYAQRLEIAKARVALLEWELGNAIDYVVATFKPA